MALVRVPLTLPRGALSMALDLDPEAPNERTVLSFLQRGQLYEPDIATLFLRAIQPGDTVLDVGANIGVFTVLAALLAGPKGRVVGFEPAADNRQRLAANLAANDIANVTVVSHPVSDRIEDAMFHLNSDNEGGHSLWDPGRMPANRNSRENPRPVATRTTTIDAEVARLGLAPPRVIKIDTEGAEHRVLAGSAELLREFEIPYIVAELHEFGLDQLGSSQASLRHFMAELGYDTFVLYGNDAMPKLIPPNTRITSRYFINLLFSTIEHVAAIWPTERVNPHLDTPEGEPRP